MKSPYKELVIIIAAVTILLTLYYYVTTTREQVIKVGAVLPLTGEGTPDQGQASQKGILLAAEKINSQGGINGKKVKIIVEDSQCKPEKAVTAMQKLVQVDGVVAVIGDTCDSVTAAIIPIAQDNKVVLITPGSTSPKISEAGDYIFRFWFSENDLGGLTASKAYELGYRKIGIFYINNEWGYAQRDAVTSKFESLGGQVVAKNAVNPGETDFRTILLKTEESKPDAYYIGVFPDSLVLIIKQMRELGINKQIFSHGGLVGSAQVLGLGGKLLEGVIAPFVGEPSAEFQKEFMSKYNEKPGITADSAFDAMMVLGTVMQKFGTTPNEIKDGLHTIQNYTGVSGIISVDSNGDTHRPLTVMQVKNGEFVPY